MFDDSITPRAENELSLTAPVLDENILAELTASEERALAAVEEYIVPQVEDEFSDTEVAVRDTDSHTAPDRPITNQFWPPEPPTPTEVDLAQGTFTDGKPMPRNARFYKVVRRPSTDSTGND